MFFWFNIAFSKKQLFILAFNKIKIIEFLTFETSFYDLKFNVLTSETKLNLNKSFP
jgi:hypothetical protein